MSVNNTRELFAGFSPPGGFFKEVVILRKKNPAQFRRTVEQSWVFKFSGTVFLCRQDIHTA